MFVFCHYLTELCAALLAEHLYDSVHLLLYLLRSHCRVVVSDLYAQQVGLLVGEMLDVPAINGVSKILSLTDSTLTVERELEDEVETLSIPLPAVIAVSTDINTPQIPSMKAILGAAKKPVQVWSPADIGLNSVQAYSAQQVAAPKQRERQRVVIEGDGEEQIAAFVENLRKII